MALQFVCYTHMFVITNRYFCQVLAKFMGTIKQTYPCVPQILLEHDEC